MADNRQVIELYTALAQDPSKDFGWDKGLDNAIAHGYKQEWIDAIPSKVWNFCAAVGNPFKDAVIKKGDTVLDLGCGAGVDVLVASLLVGDTGKVFGVDITPKMVEVARTHAKEVHATNVKILESSFNAIGLEDESVDVVISNGAINLTSCKESVFSEIYRLLKPNGKIFFADMIDISVDEGACCSVEKNSCCETSANEDWANCVAGTMRESELIELIEKAGFEEVKCTGHTHYSTAETTEGATFTATKVARERLRKEHWDTVFKNADYTQVLWHQSTPSISLELIKTYAKSDANIIDVGCGASLLVDHLLKDNYKNITLLDTSITSLDIVKKRIHTNQVKYICSDILNFQADKKFDLWHDRAVFHFLLTEKERTKYFDVLVNALDKNAIAIISTFAVDSENRCAGLDIVQYDEQKILDILPADLKLIKVDSFLHKTPKSSTQKYISFVIERQ